MKSTFLQPHVQAKIDRRVDRLLQDLGNPEPPLRLEEVRDFLRLDLAFYTGDDPALLERAVHRLRIGTIQVFARPMLLLDAVKKFRLRAIYEPDRKRILIDNTVPQPKHRWLEAHEAIHDVLPWHRALLFGDDEITPTAACHAKMEVEANYGAGQMLFLRQRFTDEASDMTLTFKSVQALAKTYRNSQTTTLWRLVELLGSQRPLLGVVSCHPHVVRRAEDFDGNTACRHFIQSPAFGERFGAVTEAAIFTKIASYCGPQRGGPLGQAEVLVRDDFGHDHEFVFDTFYNSHEALTLAVHKRQMPVMVPV